MASTSCVPKLTVPIGVCVNPDIGTRRGDRLFFGVEGVSSSSVSDVTSFADVSGEEGASGKTSLLPSVSLRLILRVRFFGVCGFDCEDDAFDPAETDAAEMWLLTDATDGRAYSACADN